MAGPAAALGSKLPSDEDQPDPRIPGSPGPGRLHCPTAELQGPLGSHRLARRPPSRVHRSEPGCVLLRRKSGRRRRHARPAPCRDGANVLLLEPFDEVVWERTRDEAGLIRVAVSQCAVDLLTGTGREPAEAE